MERNGGASVAARGSLAWGLRRHGVLTRTERLRLTLEAVRLRLRSSRSPELRRLGLAALEDVRWPDTSLVAAARHLATQSSPAWLLGHVELLCCSALLHDLGLTALAAPKPEGACFAVSGALEAAERLRAAGAPAGFARRVSDAICLHMQPAVPERLGLEAHLLQRATLLDVLGSGRQALTSELVQAVLAQWPREGLPEALAAALRAEAARAPGTRLGLYVRRFGFAGRVASAQLDSRKGV